MNILFITTMSLLNVLRSLNTTPVKTWCKANQLVYIQGSNIFGIKYLDFCKNFSERWNLETRGMFFSSDLSCIIRGMVLRTIEIQLLDVNGSNHVKETDDTNTNTLLNPDDINLLDKHMRQDFIKPFTTKVILNSKVDGTTLCVTVIAKNTPQYSFVKQEFENDNQSLWIEIDDYILLFGTQGKIAMSDLPMIDTFLSSLTGVSTFDKKDELKDMLINNMNKNKKLLLVWNKFKIDIGSWFCSFMKSNISSYQEYPSITLAFELILCDRKTILLGHEHTEWASSWHVNDIYFLEATMVSHDNLLSFVNHMDCLNVSSWCSVPWFKVMESRSLMFEYLDYLQNYLLGISIATSSSFSFPEPIHPEGFMVTIYEYTNYRTFKLKPYAYYAAHKYNSHHNKTWLLGLPQEQVTRLSTFFPGLCMFMQENDHDMMVQVIDKFVLFLSSIISSLCQCAIPNTLEHLDTITILGPKISQALNNAISKNNIRGAYGLIFNHDILIKHKINKNVKVLFPMIKTIFSVCKINAYTCYDTIMAKIQEYLTTNIYDFLDKAHISNIEFQKLVTDL